jgi:dihydrofolate reductase
MRKLRYLVATSLDGFIAGPNGEYDWIEADPEVDFRSIWAQFDTLLMGRRTYEAAMALGNRKGFGGVRSIVFSRTLKPRNGSGIEVLRSASDDWLRALKEESGKDIWLFGGGELFRSLSDAGHVDTVEVTILPVLLGTGIPLRPAPYARQNLKLVSHRIYRSGKVSLRYEVIGQR